MDEELASEQECIKRVISGDSEAYSMIVKKYMKRAYYIAYSFVKSEADALDISRTLLSGPFGTLKNSSPTVIFSPGFTGY